MRAGTRPNLVKYQESPLPAVPGPRPRRRHPTEVGGNGGSLVAAAARLVERVWIALDQTVPDHRPGAIVLTIAEVRPFADRGRR